MTEIYLASPKSQQQADYANGFNVLLSYPSFSKWLYNYQQTFRKILIDSGAYSEFHSGVKIDIEAYKDFTEQWKGIAEAIAGLDDISGNYKRSLENYSKIPWSFPTYHTSDPPEIIPELVSIAKERKTWIAIGLTWPRQGKETLIREFLEQVPENMHVHGWACRRYSHIRRFDSIDSNSWVQDSMRIRQLNDLKHLTFGECMEIIIKSYERENRLMKEDPKSKQDSLFDLIGVNND